MENQVIEPTTEVSVKRGRPAVASSARQQRLQAWDAARAQGVIIKRGRPKTKVVATETPNTEVA